MMDRSGVASTAINDQMSARGDAMARWIIISMQRRKRRAADRRPSFVGITDDICVLMLALK